MRYLLCTTAIIALAACGNDYEAANSAGAPDDATQEPASEAPSDMTAGATPEEDPDMQAAGMSGDPVEQGPPNVPSQEPAFENQTRAPAVESGVTLEAEKIADIDEPWGMAFLPDGSMLVTARGGTLYHVMADGTMNEVAGVPEVDNRDQGGLLDISVSPDFGTDRMVYFAFSEPRGNGENGTSLARGALAEDNASLENVEVIFQQMPSWASTKHYGNNIVWDNNGNLYLTLGERSNPEPRQLAQDLDAHLGKVVRMTPDGEAPDGNPFLGDEDAYDEIWSYGHRNVQGAALHPDTGRLWTIEHGPRGGDEINVPEPGLNYGWPVITYGQDYDGTPIGEGITKQDGMEQPVYYWDPVIAPGDMVFYEGDMFAEWEGDLLISSLKPGAIVRLELDGERVIGEERLLTDLARIRDIDVAADGSLIVLTDEDDGGVYRVTPATM